MPSIALEIETRRLSEEDFTDVCEQVFEFCQETSPVDTGFFQSEWVMNLEYPRCRIFNDTEYASYLDEGWSKQAPNGIIGPATVFLRKLVQGY